MYLRGASGRREAPNMEFYWNSTQTVEFLKLFLSLSDNMLSVKFQYRNSCLEVFCEKGVLRNFAKFKKNSSARVSFLMKLQTEACTLLKRRLWRTCFPVNFAKFLRTPFLTEHFRWLLLSIRYFKMENHFRFRHLIKTFMLKSCLGWVVLKKRNYSLDK